MFMKQPRIAHTHTQLTTRKSKRELKRQRCDKQKKRSHKNSLRLDFIHFVIAGLYSITSVSFDSSSFTQIAVAVVVWVRQKFRKISKKKREFKKKNTQSKLSLCPESMIPRVHNVFKFYVQKINLKSSWRVSYIKSDFVLTIRSDNCTRNLNLPAKEWATELEMEE